MKKSTLQERMQVEQETVIIIKKEEAKRSVNKSKKQKNKPE